MPFCRTLRALALASVVAAPLFAAPHFAAPHFAAAQSTTSGAVAGTVTGPDGQPVSPASLVLSTPDAPNRNASTTPDGAFRLTELPSGTYTLTVTAPGFATSQQTSVAVAVGRTTHLAVRLALAAAQQTVTVTAAQTTFDTTQTSSVTNIDRDRVEELPIPSRNYLTFVLLSPQVAAANPAQLAVAAAPVTSPSFSFGGLRPGSNAVFLDDTNDNDEFTGGSRTELSPEAISDFQIVNHGFQPQSGGAAGGSIDVQTRTGVNRLHGDAFLFAQNGALNATPPLERVPTRPDESRLRAGIALGGPIQRDRTFFYLAAEQEHARGEDASDLSPSTLATLNAARPAYIAPLTAGFIPTADEETELSGRLDRTLTPRHAAMLRYAFTNSRNVADAFNTQDFADRSARGSSYTADNSLNGTLTSTLTDSTLNKLSFELAQRRAVTRTASTTTPGILIPGVALFSTPFSGNGRRFETHTELADTLSLQRHAHLLTFGLRADHVALRAHAPDAAAGLFVFSDLAAFQAATPDAFTQSFGGFDTNFAELRLAAFAQDHWTLSPRLTLDYGLRYDLNRLPAPLPTAALHLAPRLGLAYTPYKSLVLRSGFGLFFDRLQLSTLNRLLDLNGTRAFTQIVEGPAAAGIYQSQTAPTAPIPNVAPSIWRVQPNLHNPYSQVASLSAEQSLPLQTTLTAEYQFVRGLHLGRTTNINLAPPVILTAANAASLGIPSPTPQQLGRLVFTPARLNPAFDAINQFATTAASTYNGATVTLNRQFQDDLQIMAGYTYSKTLDDASSDLEQPANPYDLAAEHSLSLQDQRHRLTLSGLWLLGPDLGDPADAAKNANPSPLMKALYGLEFAPILSFTSGFHANPITGLDSTREHIFPFAARPLAAGGATYARNSLTTPHQVNLDLRILRMVALGPGHLDIVAESFNLLNHPNIALLNTAFGSALTPNPAFDHPTNTSTSRRLQFSLDYEF